MVLPAAFKRSTLGIGVLSALSLMAASALAQTPERIEVTGSRIKRLSSEGPSTVEIITREQIDRKGVASTNDLLRSLSYMSSVNDELVSNSPNLSGAASAGFRGLAGTQTVVLLNGRRLANYGFDGDFVNLNTIPIGAIQRVEVLKDGAAAIYGADAKGNFVLFGETIGSWVAGQPNEGQVDLFLLRVSPTGQRLAARQWGTAGDDAAGRLALDACGQALAVGSASVTTTGLRRAGVLWFWRT